MNLPSTLEQAKVTLDGLKQIRRYWHQLIIEAREIDREIAYKNTYKLTKDRLFSIIKKPSSILKNNLISKASYDWLTVEEHIESLAKEAWATARNKWFMFLWWFGSYKAGETLDTLLNWEKVNAEDLRRFQLVMKSEAFWKAVSKIWTDKLNELGLLEEYELLEEIWGVEVLQCIITSWKYIIDLTKWLALEILDPKLETDGDKSKN